MLTCFALISALVVPKLMQNPMPGLVANLPSHTRVLFQGDSITDMNRGRTADPNHILGHSYAFLIAARAGSAYPEREVEFINRGVSGNRVQDLESRWQADTMDLKPDILSILVGANDLDLGVPAEEFESGYDRLLTQTRQALPNVRLIICEPFGLPTGKEKSVWATYKAELAQRQEIVARLAEWHHATYVPLQSIFDQACTRAAAEHWIWDGIHPTYAGQQLIADAWVAAVNRALVSPLEDPSQNSAINPQVNFERDSYDWLHRHADVLDEQAKGNPDVVLIGDSITHFWGGKPESSQKNGPKAWAKNFRGVKVLNMGFGWDRTQNVLWRLQHGEFADLKPKTIVLNIGTNNLVGDSTARENTPEETAAGIIEIVSELRSRSPASQIFVMGVFPRGFDNGNELDCRITTLNMVLEKSFKSIAQVVFLNIGSKLREPDGSVSPRIFFDGTHPTEAGFSIWGKALLDAGAIPKPNG